MSDEDFRDGLPADLLVIHERDGTGHYCWARDEETLCGLPTGGWFNGEPEQRSCRAEFCAACAYRLHKLHYS